MEITNAKKLFSVLNKYIHNPHLETCLVGRNFQTDTTRENWYYEFTLIHGPSNQPIKFNRSYSKVMTEEEIMDDILHIVKKTSVSLKNIK